MAKGARPASFDPPLKITVEAEGKQFHFGFDPEHIADVGYGPGGMLKGDPRSGSEAERLMDLRGLEAYLVEQWTAKIRADMKPSMTSDVSAERAAREVVAKLDPYLRKQMGLPTLQ